MRISALVSVHVYLISGRTAQDAENGTGCAMCRTLPYARTHTHTQSLTDTAACVQSHTPTCRVLLLLLPDKSLSIDPCLCTSEAAAGGKERERRTRVVNFCLNSDDGKSSVNTPAALFLPPLPERAPASPLLRAFQFPALPRSIVYLSPFLLLPPIRFCSVPPLAPCCPSAVLKGEISAFSAVPESGSSELPGSSAATALPGLVQPD